MRGSIKRVTTDLRSLHNDLPPYFVMPHGAGEDLTQLDILITGPPHTPYEAGLWKLHVEIPPEYPSTPPTASFRTAIFHPNVDPQTGAVCVETLKREWSSKLTLRDILVVISCLLIQPNPDSALNAEAGALIQQNYELFARRATMMVDIHARVPDHMKQAVLDAQSRGSETKQGAEAMSGQNSGNSRIPQAPVRERRIIDRRHHRIASRQSNGSPDEASHYADSIRHDRDDVFMSSVDNSVDDQENGPRPCYDFAGASYTSTPRRPPGPPVPLGELIMDDVPEPEEGPDEVSSLRESPIKTVTRRLFESNVLESSLDARNGGRSLFADYTMDDEINPENMVSTTKRSHDSSNEIGHPSKRRTLSAEQLWSLCGKDVNRWNRCDFDGKPFKMVAARW